jgi:hypothetical protein
MRNCVPLAKVMKSQIMIRRTGDAHTPVDGISMDNQQMKKTPDNEFLHATTRANLDTNHCMATARAG